jgi:proteasome lid subunit RPN8/RPN11
VSEIPTSTLVLPNDLRELLEQLACSAYPFEACGLLLGAHERDSTTRRVQAIRATRNVQVERARDRYEIDPVEHLAIECEAHALGLEVVGVWHTHPDHPARPSATDRERAWSGWSYVIVSVGAAGAGEVSSWQLVAGEFHRERCAP